MRVVELRPNQPRRFYRGGDRIAALRGTQSADGYRPEDWVGSTTTLFGEEEAGLTRLPDGTLLRDAIEADPEGFLGPAHAEAFGADPGLLVKLLDAGQRLPVHAHPDREFSRRHLDCPYGKTEAWVIARADDDPVVHLGFRRDVAADELRRWVVEQDSAALLEAMHEVPVREGDAVLVPAGLPHAIGAGVLVVELQEPTDLSVLMEWEGFDVHGARDGHLALGFDMALRAVDRSGWGADQLERLRTCPDSDRPRASVLPPAADPFFRAERIRPGGESARLERGFAILAVLGGSGSLRAEGGAETPLRHGAMLLVPHAAGPTRVEGDVEVLRCRPPAHPPR